MKSTLYTAHRPSSLCRARRKRAKSLIFRTSKVHDTPRGSAVLNAMMRAGPGSIRMRCALPADDCSGPAPGTQPYRTSLHNSTRACMSVPSVRPSEGSPCRTPPALRTLGLAASHARPRTHGTPHAREIDRACSPLVAAPALPAASRRVPHSFASGLLQSRVRPPPRPQLDPTESRRYLGGRPWTRRNLGGIWAAALPPPPRLFGSSRCAPPTEPQCVPCAPCRNGVPLPTRLPRMYPSEAVRTPAWRMPY